MKYTYQTVSANPGFFAIFLVQSDVGEGLDHEQPYILEPIIAWRIPFDEQNKQCDAEAITPEGHGMGINATLCPDGKVIGISQTYDSMNAYLREMWQSIRGKVMKRATG